MLNIPQALLFFFADALYLLMCSYAKIIQFFTPWDSSATRQNTALEKRFYCSTDFSLVRACLSLEKGGCHIHFFTGLRIRELLETYDFVFEPVCLSLYLSIYYSPHSSTCGVRYFTFIFIYLLISSAICLSTY